MEGSSVAVYCRLSKDDLSLGESSSITTQKMILKKYAHMKNWDIHEFYIDDGWSGTNFERPSFKKMIADIESGLISIVLVKDLSRLGRNHLQLGYYTDIYFPEHMVQFVSVLDEIDSLNAPSDLAPIKNFVNEMQARQISQNTSKSLRAKAEAGLFMGAYAPYGYQLHSDNHHKLYVDPKAANMVKDIYQWCIDGDGFTKIARRLNELKTLCPTDYLNKKQPFFFSSSYHNRYHEWNMTSVRMILLNPVYKGMLVQNRRSSSTFRDNKQIKTSPDTWSIKEHTHRAIIDSTTWDAAQEAIAKRRACAKVDRKKRHDYVGIFKCHECGSAMVYTEHGSKCFFQCGKSHSKGVKYCTTHYISHFDLEECILTQIQKYAKLCAGDENEAKNQLSKRIIDQYSSSNSLLDKKIHKLEQSIQEVNTCIIDAFDQVYAEKIEYSRFQLLINKFETQLQTLEAKRDLAQGQRVNVDALIGQIDSFIKLIRHYRYAKNLTPDIVHDLIERIEISEKETEDGRKKKVLIYFKHVGLLSSKGRWF